MDTDLNDLGYQIIGAAFEVRKQLGRFLYEDTYERALQIELQLRGIQSARQVSLPIEYKGYKLDNACRVDMIVEDKILIELKSLERMGASEVSQLMTYLKMSNFQLGYLINFGALDFTTERFPEEEMLYKGIYRFVNT